jgi:hypothetical protein
VAVPLTLLLLLLLLLWLLVLLPLLLLLSHAGVLCLRRRHLHIQVLWQDNGDAPRLPLLRLLLLPSPLLLLPPSGPHVTLLLLVLLLLWLLRWPLWRLRLTVALSDAAHPRLRRQGRCRCRLPLLGAPGGASRHVQGGRQPLRHLK